MDISKFFSPENKALRQIKKDDKKVAQKIELVKKQTKNKQIADKRLAERQEHKDISGFIESWIRLMAYLKLDNQLDETFALTNIKKTVYGFSCNINVANGLSLATLEEEKMISTIEDNSGCLFMTTRIPKTKQLEAKFVIEDIPEIDFVPYSTASKHKLEPYELYLSTSLDGEPVVANMLTHPHVLIQGATNSGKTRMIDCIATNLIAQNSPEDVSLYFIQVDKSDQVIYRKCKHTRAYANDIYKTLAITNYLIQVINSRDKALSPMIENGICNDINGFNKVYKKYKQSKFNYIYLIIDEYSSLMPSEEGDKTKKIVKGLIQENMERLIQIGRYVGVYVIIGLQRATIDKVPSFVKAMSNTIVSFHVNNERSSFVALDTNEAVKLKQREAIIKTDDKIMTKTVTITPAMILHYTKPFHWSNGTYRNFIFDSWLPDEFKKKQEFKQVKESKNQKRKNERYGTNDDENEMTDDELFNLIKKNKK